MIKISDAELEVMNIVWDKKETTSEEIIKLLKYRNWKDSTIRTLIGRLVTKKAIEVSKKKGKLYFYISLIDEKKYKINVMKKFIDQFFHGSFQEFIVFLIKEDPSYYKKLVDIVKNDKY